MSKQRYVNYTGILHEKWAIVLHMGLSEEQVLGGLFGVCIGDALGVPVEGCSRFFLKRNPVQGFGYSGISRRVPDGWWSDDSSLTLCTAESLVETGKKGIDLRDMGNRFCMWLHEGHWTPGGKAFGIGYTTAEALERIRSGVAPQQAGGRDEYSNGNGSLMRILPLALYLFGERGGDSFEQVHDVSSITHGHPRSHVACGIYVQFAQHLLVGDGLQQSYEATKREVVCRYQVTLYREELAHYARVLEGDISCLDEHDVRSSGYVVDTLEASLWCLLSGRSFGESVLNAVNLGGDTDTTGAVTGGLAGLLYGFRSIPTAWLDRVARRDDILDLGRRLLQSISS